MTNEPNPLEQYQNMIEDVPFMVDPIYDHDSPNEEIQLYEGDFILSGIDGSDESYEGDGAIYFEWLPTPKAKLHGTISASPEAINRLIGPSKYRMDLPEEDFDGVVLVTGTNIDALDRDEIDITAEVHGGISNQNTDSVTKIKFHVPNFHNFLGNSIRYEAEDNTMSTGKGRLPLKSGDYETVIDKELNYSDKLAELKKEGGYYLGQVGEITKEDQSSFDESEVENILSAVDYFLSFAKGCWCGSILSTGLADDEIVFSDWDDKKLSAWRSYKSWFPDRDLRGVPDVFRTIHQKLSDDSWEDIIKRTIHNYIEANNRDLAESTRLTLTQFAFEMLSWVFLVERSNSYTSQQFKNLDAQEKIIELLTLKDIPIEIPDFRPRLEDLKTFFRSEGYDWVEYGPDLIVALRNMTVHPTEVKRERFSEISGEQKMLVRQLSLYYLELLILRICNYQGKIRNRLRRGSPQEVNEQVPWVDDEPDEIFQ